MAGISCLSACRIQSFIEIERDRIAAVMKIGSTGSL